MLLPKGAAMIDFWQDVGIWLPMAIIPGVLLQLAALFLRTRPRLWLLGTGAALVMIAAAWERDVLLLVVQPVITLMLLLRKAR